MLTFIKTFCKEKYQELVIPRIKNNFHLIIEIATQFGKQRN